MRLQDRKVLARLMVIHHLSQRQMAEAAGWRSHSYLGRLLRGEAFAVEPGAAARIAAKLGVPMGALFTAGASPETESDDRDHRTTGPRSAPSVAEDRDD